LAERRRAQGERTEAFAEAFLRRAGYAILARNARTRWGELDIVAQDGGEVVFVEVKSRQVGARTPAVASVTAPKVARLIRLAEAYLEGWSGGEPPWRIDVITVLVGPDGAPRSLEHMRHAVRP